MIIRTFVIWCERIDHLKLETENLKKLSVSIIITFAVLFIGIARAAATEISETTTMPTMITPGPFEGVFSGSVRGDNGSQAPIELKLTHRNEDVEGSIILGEGLYVNGGRCGGANIPFTEQNVAVKTQPGNPHQLSTQLKVIVSKIQIGINLESLISEDGHTITSKASIDLPWICGRDPVLTGILYRNE